MGDKEHPESTCERCKGRNVTWFTASPLWNECSGEHDILCPLCFVELAGAKGHDTDAWYLVPEFYAEGT